MLINLLQFFWTQDYPPRMCSCLNPIKFRWNWSGFGQFDAVCQPHEVYHPIVHRKHFTEVRVSEQKIKKYSLSLVEYFASLFYR
ncbi:hypothetical protein PL8927_790138 [Planktothrix serta PCC 8927]|uniref:Uncharacterized protein n=1 Tax=Planktothrix serta PCC 8927 TaxID=671068 RepID=A0A7Z9E3S0_9CYAN|nr:hypothetical protein PL8927_790138 [Planktothrix serta PCC 8927]